MGSVFGSSIKFGLFGESHGEAIGCVIDGFPYGINIDNDFIYNEMIKNDAYEYVSVVCFKNKLVIEYDYDMNIVICKNIDDCIRLYNTLNDRCLSEKITKAVFKGQITFKSSLYKGIIHKIMEKTGWKETKVCRASTRP